MIICTFTFNFVITLPSNVVRLTVLITDCPHNYFYTPFMVTDI